jgi:hypothetical protein
VSDDVTRDSRNDSKSEGSDGKDANHCGEKTVVVRREWMLSERRGKENGRAEARIEGKGGEGGEENEKKEKKNRRGLYTDTHGSAK